MGQIFTYICCPYCSHSILLNKFKRATFPISPLEFFILHKREQKHDPGYAFGEGKGHRGFFRIEGSQKTIQQLLSGDPQEREIAHKIIARVKTICQTYATLREGTI